MSKIFLKEKVYGHFKGIGLKIILIIFLWKKER